MKFEIYIGIAVGASFALGFRQADMASSLFAGVLLFEIVTMGAERWRAGREAQAYRAKLCILRKAWPDAAPSTRREGVTRAGVDPTCYQPVYHWAPPATPPRNVRIVHAPGGAVEVVGKDGAR